MLLEDLKPLYFESGCNWEEGRKVDINKRELLGRLEGRGEDWIGEGNEDARTRPESNSVLVEVKRSSSAKIMSKMT